MGTKASLLVGLISMAFISSAWAVGTSACEDLSEPFRSLGQMTLDPAVQNPPKLQLCHRSGNSYRHYTHGRIDKTVDELKKLINETQRSVSRHIEGSYAEAIIAEAKRVIEIVVGSSVPEVGSVSGGVFRFGSETPVPGAQVILKFPETGALWTTETDANGLFSLADVDPAGTFIVEATDGVGAHGTASGALLETELSASVMIYVDQPGNGEIQGVVQTPELEPSVGALVTAIFPDSGRSYTTTVGATGTYMLQGLRTDGTVILIAFDGASGASASDSNVLTAGFPARTVHFVLTAPSLVNPELTNSDFSNGLSGWSYTGPIQVIDRNLIFSTPNL